MILNRAMFGLEKTPHPDISRMTCKPKTDLRIFANLVCENVKDNGVLSSHIFSTEHEPKIKRRFKFTFDPKKPWKECIKIGVKREAG